MNKPDNRLMPHIRAITSIGKGMERTSILGEANWGSYLSDGLHGAAAGASGGAATGAVAGAIGGAGVGAAPGAAAGAVLGGAGGFLSGFLGNAANDMVFNLKSPQDKASHMAGALREKLAIISSYLEKTNPAKAKALQSLGQQFKDYIDAVVQGKENINLSNNIFMTHAQSPKVAQTAPKFRTAGLADTWVSSAGDGLLNGGANYLLTGDMQDSLEKAGQGFAVDRANDAATGLMRNQIQKGTGQAAQYLAKGMAPAALEAGAAGGAGAAGLGAVALPAAAGLAAGFAGNMAAQWVGDQAENLYYGTNDGRVRAEMGDVDKMISALGEITTISSEGSQAVQFLSTVLHQIMSSKGPALASGMHKMRRFSTKS